MPLIYLCVSVFQLRLITLWLIFSLFVPFSSDLYPCIYSISLSTDLSHMSFSWLYAVYHVSPFSNQCTDPLSLLPELPPLPGASPVPFCLSTWNSDEWSVRSGYRLDLGGISFKSTGGRRGQQGTRSPVTFILSALMGWCHWEGGNNADQAARILCLCLSFVNLLSF